MPEPEQGMEPGDDAMNLNDRRARTRAGAALGRSSHPDLARRHQRTSNSRSSTAWRPPG